VKVTTTARHEEETKGFGREREKKYINYFFVPKLYASLFNDIGKQIEEVI
jgi:hypothetical protein